MMHYRTNEYADGGELDTIVFMVLVAAITVLGVLFNGWPALVTAGAGVESARSSQSTSQLVLE